MIWQNFLLALNKFATFKGRSRRAEYWGFFLVTILFGMAASAWDNAIFEGEVFARMLDMVFFIPSIAVSTRRLHDIGRSGWWQLIALTGIGFFVLLYWYCKDSEQTTNEYGPSPKYGLANGNDEPFMNDDDQIV
ncbi:MAG: DUF805 domain-containing protein [Bacteroidota bacterium]